MGAENLGVVLDYCHTLMANEHPAKVAALASSTFWFILPSLPMFLLIPLLLRSGWSFPLTMAVAIAVTIALYAGLNWLAPRVGIAL